jgi:4-hydroxy-2-oxoheptanedioate aldolase
MVRAAEAAGTVPIVRVAENNPSAICRALDIGALGVQVPQVTTAEDAHRAVQAARYYPAGSRGVAMMRSAQYSAVNPSGYFARANAETMVVLHCESVESVENLPEILKVEGIDVVFVGPFDLSQSLGKPGQVNLPEVQDTVERALNAIIASGVAAGSVALSPAHARLLIQRGVRYVTLGADYLLLLDRCRNDLIDARRPEGEKPI